MKYADRGIKEGEGGKRVKWREAKTIKE